MQNIIKAGSGPPGDEATPIPLPLHPTPYGCLSQLPHDTSVELTNDVTGPPANGSEVGVEGKDSEMKEGKNEAYYRKRKIVLKIVVPVLLSVASILTLSAVIVGLSACLCERNRRYLRVIMVETKGLSSFQG